MPRLQGPDSDRYRRRWREVWDAVASAGQEVLLVVGRGAPGEYGYLHYLSGYMPGHRPAFAVLSADVELTVIAPTRVDAHLADASDAIVATRYVAPAPGSSPIAAVMTELCRTGGSRPSRIAVAGMESLGYKAGQLLDRGMAGSQIEDGSSLLGKAKAVKDEHDHLGLARAASVADAGLAVAETATRAGARVASVKAAVQAEVSRLGSELTLVLAGAGPVGGVLADRPLQAGDVLSLIVEVSVDGYWVEAGAAYAVGRVEGPLRDLASECLELGSGLAGLLMPGIQASRVARHAQEFTTGRGRTATLGVGHGVGIDADPPDLSAGVETLIEAGAAIALHPSLADLEASRGLALANTYIVGPHGARPVSERGGRLYGMAGT